MKYIGGGRNTPSDFIYVISSNQKTENKHRIYPSLMCDVVSGPQLLPGIRSTEQTQTAQQTVCVDARAQLSATWQLACSSDYHHSLKALNCVKKQMLEVTSWTRGGRSDGQPQTPAFSFRATAPPPRLSPQLDFHSHALSGLFVFGCLHHGNNVLSFCPKLSDILVNKSFSFKYDCQAACFTPSLSFCRGLAH